MKIVNVYLFLIGFLQLVSEQGFLENLGKIIALPAIVPNNLRTIQSLICTTNLDTIQSLFNPSFNPYSIHHINPPT
jgi:hypothetical protein